MDNESKSNPYSQSIRTYLVSFYIASIIIWIFLCVILKLYSNIWGKIIFFIPIIVYGINIWNICNTLQPVNPEEADFTSETLTLGILSLIPLIIWTHDKPLKHGKDIIISILVSMALGVISLLDIWVNKKSVILIKHIRSIIQTMSLCLMVYALLLLIFDIVEQKGHSL